MYAKPNQMGRLRGQHFFKPISKLFINQNEIGNTADFDRNPPTKNNQLESDTLEFDSIQGSVPLDITVSNELPIYEKAIALSDDSRLYFITINENQNPNR